MLEEFGLLRRAKSDKMAVGCKWTFTVKQNLENRVERYKARFMVKGYSQIYDIDYDKTFTLVSKMSTVRRLISLAANER
jgi:Reverse transcriptase (RNA-dependent DNA polymerase)